MARQKYWRSIIDDAALALCIAAILAIGWTVRDWPMLSVMHLPDTDDAMRLQQIRDWLAGQSFRDVSQHRLGSAGLIMHWSRLPDLVPAGLIAQLTPYWGAGRASLITVILWPSILFAGALFLIARIARVIDPAIARTAIIVAAVSYPATTLFLPGRIDHHGLQIVLLLVIVRALMARAGHVSGAVIGFAACASLVIGLETAPFLLIAAILVWAGWTIGRPGRQLLGFGLAIGLGLAFAKIIFAPDGWTYPACDGFTQSAWQTAQLASFAPVILALGGAFTTSPRTRIAASGLIGLGGAAIAWPVAHGCATPYGGVDPLLARLWLNNVGEAQSLLTAPAGVAFGYVGLLVVGTFASLCCAYRRPRITWAGIIGLQLASLALCFLQLRGAYVGAILAAPALAAAIAAARARGSAWLAGAWLGSAGMLYPIAAQAVTIGSPPPAPASAITNDGAACTSPAMMAALNQLPTGTVVAPIDLGAYAIAATRHRLIAAPYHRNNAGNAAMLRFFLSDSDAAHRIAALLGIDYVVICPGGLATLGPTIHNDPRRLIGQLAAGNPPAWLHPVRIGATRGEIFAVRHGLSNAPLPH